MALRQRSVLAAAAVCVVLVLTLLLLAAPPPEGLRDKVMRLASFGRGPEEAAERANDADDSEGNVEALEDDPQPFGDADFYGGFPMFGDMMDFWLRENLSRVLNNGEHRFGRRELADNLLDENDKT